MIGKVLEPRNNHVRKAMKKINDYWLESDVGICGVGLKSINEYNHQLKTLMGVSCNNSYEKFEEGIYPIDCTDENLKKLTSEKLPEKLDDLIKWKGKLQSFIGCINRWHLYILGDNCD